jgi:hypothetical protein
MSRKKKKYIKKTKETYKRKTLADYYKGKKPTVVVRTEQAQILKMYSQGKSVSQIAIDLEMPANVVTKNLNTVIDRMIEHYAKSTPQQTFVTYAAFQMGIVQKLQKTYEKYISSDVKQFNAGIQALRGMSDIYDKVLAKGIEFGVIEQKKADRKSIEGKALDIKGELVAEITQLQKLVETIDESTAGRAMLQGKNDNANQGGKRTISRTSIKYTRIIRKPLRDKFGVKRTIPDWKYRTKVFVTNEEGKAMPVRQGDLTEEQRLTLASYDPDKKLHEELANEKNKILVRTHDGSTYKVERDKLRAVSDDDEREEGFPTSQNKSTPKKNQREESNYLVKPRKASMDIDTE